MNPPDFTLDKIKFSIDKSTFEKAVALYKGGKVTQVREGIRSYSGVILGTKPYRVSVEARNYKYSSCDCYLGENGTLCKHMVALALHVVKNGEPLSAQDSKQITEPACSGILCQPSAEESEVAKRNITMAMRYIKPYHGPSSTWDANQESLEEGCSRLSAVVARLPVHPESTKLLIDLLLRLDKKLQMGGVDDSNGIVGGFIEEVVNVLKEYVWLDPACKGTFVKLAKVGTCFGWEASLVKMIDE
ncbi:MAG: hypothetical protein NTW50_03240 [Candidatus Berkelbacteria bacterium]|nr:hypothetical protein [Candidatus Berkelbacteria bacterium]